MSLIGPILQAIESHIDTICSVYCSIDQQESPQLATTTTTTKADDQCCRLFIRPVRTRENMRRA